MQPTIAVIGAGFSGTLLSLHLLRHAQAGTRIVLIERNRTFGPGLAYSTSNSSHRLNVPAGRMSAFAAEPNDFLEWLQRHPAGLPDGVEPAAGAFVPRHLYGAYLRHLLDAQPSDGSALARLNASVEAAEYVGDTLRLTLDSGAAISADIAVLATGNAKPEPPALEAPGLYESRCWRADPWSTDAFSGLDPAAGVLLIGTGLTMVDAVISLLDGGHTGPIYAMSRRGLLPCRHAAAGSPARAVPNPLTVEPLTAEPLTAGIRALAQMLRRRIADAVNAGEDWRPVIDALRPITCDLWQALSMADRQRFLRHLRPWWEVHRHRMPGAVADRIDAARASGQLRIMAGRIIGCSDPGETIDVRYRARGAATPDSLRVSRVVNCSGPATGYDRIADPLISNLVATGMVRPDRLRLGLDVTADGAVSNRNGVISQSLFAVGPLTRGMFWEMTAVPDIRRQCEAMALHVSALLQNRAAALAFPTAFLLHA